MKRLLLVLFFPTLMLAGCKKGGDTPEPTPSPSQNGVLINGVIWAKCNVDAPGIFAAAPESYGMFYQWNRKTAWPSTGAISNWDSSYPTGVNWETANDPCPAGWHVPDQAQQATLLDVSKVAYEWTTFNGVNGGKFTDKLSGNSIFLPAAGYRSFLVGSLFTAGNYGNYWSGSSTSTYGAWFLLFYSGSAYQGSDSRPYGFTVRCIFQ